MREVRWGVKRGDVVERGVRFRQTVRARLLDRSLLIVEVRFWAIYS